MVHWTPTQLHAIWNRKDHPHCTGTCWHCGGALSFNDRSTWHVDHYPVTQADIEDQCCFGITQVDDMRNVVPSCPSCNLSHRHERKKWCGQSQIRCRSSVWSIRANRIVFFYSVCSLEKHVFRGLHRMARSRLWYNMFSP